MIACEKNNVEELINQESELDLRQKNYAAYNRYVSKHGVLKIEHASLEELNEMFEENGLPPVTLEEIGITEEEYRLGQERVNNPEFSKSRCNAFYWYLGDMNQSGSATTFDLILARRVMLGLLPVSDQSQNFALINYFFEGGSVGLEQRDVDIMFGMILGTITC